MMSNSECSDDVHVGERCPHQERKEEEREREKTKNQKQQQQTKTNKTTH
jgi:hypothetical protein